MRSVDNPFELNKASDYSDQQIHECWVDAVEAQGGLSSILKPRGVVPMLLLGGKGSGKTHLMRHCSAQVQALRYGGNLEAAVSAEGYLGIYARADGLNVERFFGKGQPPDTWDSVFAFAFELWLGLTLLACLQRHLTCAGVSSTVDSAMARDIHALLHAGGSSVSNLAGLSAELQQIQRRLDRSVNNCAISRTLVGVEIAFNPGDLLFGVPEIAAAHIPSLRGTTFTYLIDEVENFSTEQQRFLNDLIRYRRGRATIRVGARLYGIKTRATRGSGEPIKLNAEYQQVELDETLRNDSQSYARLARRLILNRVRAGGATRHALSEESLDACFAEVPTTNYFLDIAQQIVRSREKEGVQRTHIERLRVALRRAAGQGHGDLADQIIDSLALPESPMLEKVNLLSFYKRLSTSVDPVGLAAQIAIEARCLLQQNGPRPDKYYEVYSHFSSDLLAQLCRDYQQRPIYSGLKTLIRISQGVPRNLLILLSNVHRRAVFAGETPFAGDPISLSAQTEGVSDASAWFWEDAQPDQFGPQVRSVVESLGTLFRAIRYADNPSECDLCSFRIDTAKLSDRERQMLDRAQNWSFLVRTGTSVGAKNDNRLVAKYQLNPMLAARWGVSESRRGSIELTGQLATAIFGMSDSTDALIRERTSDMMVDALLLRRLRPGWQSGKQATIFDEDE